MAEELGAAANTSDELEMELKRLKGIASGQTGGIDSVRYSSKAIDKLKENKQQADKQAAEYKCLGGPVGLLSYAAACYRDAKYCQRGRKFMRIAGLNGKVRATFARAEMIEEATEETS